MDSSHYPSNGINTTSAPQTYPSPTAISPNQLQTGSPLPQTLPPLQPPTSAMQPMYGSHPHTPRTPGTPNTPNSTGNVPTYQNTSQPGSRPGIYSMAQNPYPPHPAYGASAPMMPQATTAASHPHPQPIAPAPAGGRGPPVLRPMPPGGIMPQGGAPSPYGPGSLMQPNPVLQEGDQPTHVVGSQGRRGILPSAPGRPAAPAAGTGAAKSTVIPVKDADGKFPCPHCTKTYLHAKHLKRHLLRHTGDRPYMCVLCRDTFSRSDILKRHFQKCSIRRGNPTGASHLSHPQAHVKKNAQAQKAAGLANEGDLNPLNGLNNMPPADGMVHPFGMVPVQDGMNSMAGDQNHLSRTNSMNRLENGANQDRRSMPGMGNSQPYGGDVSNPMNNQAMPTYGVPHGQNGMPMYGGSNANQQSGLDWSQMFQAGAHPILNEHPFHPPNLGQTQIGTKTGPKTSVKTTGCRPSDAVVYSEWGVPSNVQDSFTHLSNQILNFFYPPTEAIDPHLTGTNLYLSPECVEDFLGHYDKFHQHAPLLHAPSFRIMEAHAGLVTCMCCIGACYSARAEQSVVREMMDALWTSMERTCLSRSRHGADEAREAGADVEQLQALVLMSLLHVWNGTHQQRLRARRAFPQIASQARRLGLHSAKRGGKLGPEAHDWAAWAEREQRTRLMHAVLMCDTVWALYCNVPPQFDPLETHIPLPCEEAAWRTRDPLEWASLVGAWSTPGTGPSEQPELDLALRTLLHPLYRIGKGSTSAAGNWTLLFAVMALVWRVQRGRSLGHLEPASGSLPPREWIVRHVGVKAETGPPDGAARILDAQSYLVLSDALDQVKSALDDRWSQPFAADAVMLSDITLSFWMAKRLLTYRLPDEPTLTEEACFMQILRLVDGVKAWVLNGGEARGEKLEAVGETREHEDSTLNMTDFFDAVPRGEGDTGAAPTTD